MTAVPPTQVPHLRNGSQAGTPHMMESLDGTFQCGIVVRVTDNGLSFFERDVAGDPLDPASYTVTDLSAVADVVSGLGLLDPGNGVPGVAVEDDHFMLGFGLDDQGRAWLAGNTHADPHRVIFSGAAAGHPDPTTWDALSFASMPWASSGGNANTYNQFNRMSDGRLTWLFDQQESAGNSQGRDILAYYLPLGRSAAQILAGGTSGWRPICDTATGTGAWTGEPGTSRGELICSTQTPDSPNGPTGDPADPGPANRAYIDATFVERRGAGDRLWVSGHWRTADASSESSQRPFAIYTDAIGLNTLNSWRTVDGATLDMPLTWGSREMVEIPGLPVRNHGTKSLAVDGNGRPGLVVDNGVAGVGVLAGYGAFVRALWDGAAWQIASLGSTSQGHPSDPFLVGAGPDRELYTYTTATGQVRMRSAGGAVGGPPAVPNGVDPVGTPWQKGGPIQASGTVAYGTQVANYAEVFAAGVDPVRLSRTGELTLLVPDGDDPRVYSFGGNARVTAEP